MTTRHRQDVSATPGLARFCVGTMLTGALVMTLMLSLTSIRAVAGDDDNGKKGKFCSQTANLLFHACGSEVRNDLLVASAKCTNISDDAERTQCFADAKDSRLESEQLCREQRSTRLDACKALGEGRYDPVFDPARFDDPKHPTRPNPYFPLTVGDFWEYRGGDEVDTVKIVDETKLIDGVTCIVARDQVFKDGVLSEDTDDWYAPAKDGTTWYFGEEAKDFETFEGDNPQRPELVSIEGSFKAGRDNDKPGVIFLASPKPGDVYLEEFSLGNAEDLTEILSITYKFGNNADLDQLVPQQLAERFCSAGDCVVTRNSSLVDPGDLARKYYARGIGTFLEIESTGKVSQLVNCSFDSRCNNLPQP